MQQPPLPASLTAICTWLVITVAVTSDLSRSRRSTFTPQSLEAQQ